MSVFKASYSAIDRTVHRLAMSQLDMQKSLSTIEDRSFEKSHAGITASHPVFVTSLPRAGTTLVLELIAATPQFTAHSYRDMPFLLCPLTWERLSSRFRKPAQKQERAHGDGMMVSYDSVEAFEEILWRAFWPDHFESARIRPWAADETDEDNQFLGFFRQHMRKMIALARQRTGSTAPQRYVSKNNANIARLGWLQRSMPDATILIPFREPSAHLASLTRQHANFLELHARDPFALRYMQTIGHLEFGEALRPIDFDNWLAATSRLDPGTVDFWAEYWIAAFGAVLRAAGPSVTIFSYDRLCAAPVEGLQVLEQVIGLEPTALTGLAPRVRPPTRYDQTLDAIAPKRRRQLERILAELNALSRF